MEVSRKQKLNRPRGNIAYCYTEFPFNKGVFDRLFQTHAIQKAVDLEESGVTSPMKQKYGGILFFDIKEDVRFHHSFFAVAEMPMHELEKLWEFLRI